MPTKSKVKDSINVQALQSVLLIVKKFWFTSYKVKGIFICGNVSKGSFSLYSQSPVGKTVVGCEFVDLVSNEDNLLVRKNSIVLREKIENENLKICSLIRQERVVI